MFVGSNDEHAIRNQFMRNVGDGFGSGDASSNVIFDEGKQSRLWKVIDPQQKSQNGSNCRHRFV
jgi:hypothetical protein